MRYRTPLRFLTFLVVLFGVAFLASAQEATIVGTVIDPSGAIIPGATISIRNMDTGLVTQIQTTASGEFTAPSLHIGRYSVRVEAKGFRPVERKDVTIQIGRAHV